MAIFHCYYYYYYYLFFVNILFYPSFGLGTGQPGICGYNGSAVRCSDQGPAIRFPFRLKDIQPEICGYHGFDLYCDQSHQTVLDLPTSVKLLVKNIDYRSQVIDLYDPDSCLPRKLPKLNLSASPFQFTERHKYDFSLYNCSAPAREMPSLVPCLGVPGYNVYAILSDREIDSYALTSCSKICNISSIPYYFYDLKTDIQLNWWRPNCRNCEAENMICQLNNNTADTETETECSDKPYTNEGGTYQPLIAGVILACLLILLPVLALYQLWSSNKTEIKIEKFLEDYKALKPARYSYADIKNITNQFKDKLGQGGYGIVYKGKLSNEIYVAVKVLNNTKGNGEEFVNEVGTIGRIHHVNVVRLVGYCADGFRRALVYEFLPNDSLEKFIFTENSKNTSLGWEKLQDIALGIARGIEYLHQGCDQRIVHFDIKPHNVLLDNNFNPKIADFGLAKLCSKEQSAVSMTAARGTMGYIAPEVVSRNVGKVSSKSDVYSFGMLLLEMVGGRKNIDVTVNTSQVYFPEWVYNRLDQDKDFNIRIEEDGDAKVMRKLTIVGLSCIQWYPVDRPSMKLVIQMLEGEGDNLSMPPNPFSATNPSKTNGTTPGRALQQELAIISELD